MNSSHQDVTAKDHPLKERALAILKESPEFDALRRSGIDGFRGAQICVDEDKGMARVVFLRVPGIDTSLGFLVNTGTGAVQVLEIAMVRCADGEVRLVRIEGETCRSLDEEGAGKGDFIDCYRKCARGCSGDPYCKIQCAYGCMGSGDDDDDDGGESGG